MSIPEVIDLSAVLASGLSGALLASQKRFDLGGLAFLTLVAGLGGGLLRDVLLQQGLPVALANPVYLLVIIAAAAIGYFFERHVRRVLPALIAVDAAGLGLYAVIGCIRASQAGLSMLPTILVGVITAVGGGILRDVLADEAPVIFQREVYATAALLGSASYVVLSRVGVGPEVAGAVGFTSAAGLRLVSVWRGWNIPRLGGPP
ncbi:MAG: trimeric intracellular cation channel family protein [Myxococcaceae bacterium]